MNAREIQSYFMTRHPSGTLFVDDRVLQDIGVRAFLGDSIGTQALTLEGANYHLDRQSLRITGATHFLNTSIESATLVFDPLPDGGMSLLLTMQLPSTWDIPTSFPKLPGTFDFSGAVRTVEPSFLSTLVFTDVRFVLSSHDDVEENLFQGLNFAGSTDLGNMFNALAVLADEVDLSGIIDVSGIIRLVDAEPMLWLDAPLPLSAAIGDLKLANPMLTFISGLDATLSETSTAVFSGDLEVGRFRTQLSANMRFGDAQNLHLFGYFYDSPISLPDLEAVQDLFGGEDLASHLPDELKTLPGLALSEIAVALAPLETGADRVRSVSVKLQTTRQWEVGGDTLTLDNLQPTFFVSHPFSSSERSVDFSLEGQVFLGGVPLEFTLGFPDRIAFCRLPLLSTVALDEIFRHFGLPLDGLGIRDLDVTEFELEANLPANQIRFLARMTSAWQLVSGDTPLSISNIAIEYEKAEDTTLSASGTFTLGDSEIEVYGERGEAGWVFGGSFWAGDGFDVPGILNSLLPAAYEIPADLSILELQSGEVSFDTAQQDFLLRLAVNNSTIEFNDESSFTVQAIDIEFAKDPDALAADWRIYLDGHLLVGPLIDVESTLVIQRQAGMTTLRWDLEQDGLDFSIFLGYQDSYANFIVAFTGSLRLLDVVDVPKLDDGFDGLLTMAENWDIFTLSRLLIQYDSRTKALGFEGITAIERTAGSSIEAILKLHLAGPDSFIECAWNADGAEDNAAFGIGDLLRAFDISLDGVHPTVEAALSATSFRMKYHYKRAAISIAAQSGSDLFDKLILYMDKHDSTWDLALGVTFLDDTNLSALFAGTEINTEGLDAVDVELDYLLFANNDIDNKRLPALNGATSVETINFKAGLSASVTLRLGTPDAAELLQTAHQVIGHPSLKARVLLSTDEIEIVADVPGTINLATDSAADFELQRAYLRLQASRGSIGVGIGGTLSFELFEEMRQISAELALSTEMMAVNLQVENGDLLDDVSLIPPVFEALERLPVFPGVTLDTDNYALQIGTNFAPPALIFGVMGNFFIGRETDPYEGTYALVLHAVPGAVKPAYMALALEQFDLFAAMEARFAMQRTLDDLAKLNDAAESIAVGDEMSQVLAYSEDVIDYLQTFVAAMKATLQSMRLTNARMYWAADNVILPDGTAVNRGAGIEGRMRVFEFDAYARFEFSPGLDKGRPSVFGYAECEPLSLAGIVDLRGNGKGIPKPAVDWKPADGLPVPAADASSTTAVVTSGEYLLAPGGPVLLVNTAGSPYLQADMQIVLFGFLGAAVRATIDEHGVTGVFSAAVGEAFKADFNVTLVMSNLVPSEFRASGSMAIALDFTVPIPLEVVGDTTNTVLNTVGIDADISMEDMGLHIDTSLEAEVELIINQRDLELVFDGLFSFEGIVYTMPTLHLKLGVMAFVTRGISDAASFTAMITDHILDHAGEIFAPAFESAATAFEDLGKEIETLGEEVAEEFSQIANTLLVEPAEGLVDGLTTFGDKAGREIEQLIADLTNDAGKIADEAAKVTTEGIQAARTLVNEATTQAEAIIQEGIAALDNAAKQVDRIVAALEADLTELGRKTLQIIEDAGKAIKQFFDDAAAYAKQVLADIEAWGKGVLEDARALAAALVEQAALVWQAVEEALQKIAQLAEEAVEEVVEFVEDVGAEIEQGASEFFGAVGGIFA